MNLVSVSVHDEESGVSDAWQMLGSLVNCPAGDARNLPVIIRALADAHAAATQMFQEWLLDPTEPDESPQTDELPEGWQEQPVPERFGYGPVEVSIEQAANILNPTPSPPDTSV